MADRNARLLYNATAAAGYERGFVRVSSRFIPFLRLVQAVLRANPPKTAAKPESRRSQCGRATPITL
jgi:hypothetical protein